MSKSKKKQKKRDGGFFEAFVGQFSDALDNCLDLEKVYRERKWIKQQQKEMSIIYRKYNIY